MRGGPFHSACPEGWFVGVAGLKVVCPATVADAYGLLRSAIEDGDPVIYFEHKALYRRLKGERPDPAHRTPIGRARVAAARLRRDRRHVRRGRRPRASSLATGSTWRCSTCAPSGRSTRRPFSSQSDGRRASWCCRRPRDRAASPARSCRSSPRDGFELLDAPPVLVAPPDTPVPFAPELEDAYQPSIERVRSERGEPS